MRTVTLFIAMSLDGYIADVQGETTWLEEVSNGCMAGYDDFYQNVDTILMGKNTYDQIAAFDSWPYPDRTTYVLTHASLPDQSNICFTTTTIKDLITQLQTEEGNEIWICGGANVVKQAMEADLIDRYFITVMPILLGEGISLFETRHQALNLVLIKQTTYGNMIDLMYERKH